MKRAPSLSAALVAVLATAALLAGCSGGPRAADGAGASAQPAQSPKSGRAGWQPSKPDTLGPTVAVFGGRRLTRHDIDSVIATAPVEMHARLRTEDGYRQLVERMIFEETLLRRADLEGIENDPLYKVEASKAIRSAKMRAYYNRRIAGLPAVPDSAVRAYYDAHLAEYQIPARVRVRHIQLATQAQAASVRRQVVKGGGWDALCMKYSKDQLTKDKGGLLGYVTKETDLVPGVGAAPAIVAAAFTLKEGDTSQPVKGPKGWHLVQADNFEEATVRPFEPEQKRIRTELEGQAVDAFSASLTESLKTISNSAIFDDSIRVALSPSRTPMDFFKEAQAAVNANDRIRLYKSVAERFPADSVSVQARFMIGFTYAEDLGDYEAAKEAFEEFIKIYPNSELANSARWMIENMEKPPPTLEEDDAPPDNRKGSSGSGGASKPEQARRRP